MLNEGKGREKDGKLSRMDELEEERRRPLVSLILENPS